MLPGLIILTPWFIWIESAFREKKNKNKGLEDRPDMLQPAGETLLLQWNLSVTTTSKIKCFTLDLFSNEF